MRHFNTCELKLQAKNNLKYYKIRNFFIFFNFLFIIL